MNKMETRMLKVKNVINAFLLYFIGLLPFGVFSQANFSGTFCIDYALKDFSDCLIFETKQVFKYINTEHLGTSEYGNGEYKFIDNQLILNYNKTKPLQTGHHISEIWINNTDSIAVHFIFLNFDEKPIPYVNIFYKDSLSKNGLSGIEADTKGSAIFHLKKQKANLEFNISNIDHRPYKLPIEKNYNYNITVFLEANGNGIPIKNQIDTLQIVELKADYFMVKEKDGKKTKWIKID